MKLLNSILLALMFHFALAQEASVQSQDALLDLGNVTAFSVVVTGPQEKDFDAVGTMFFTEDFEPGKIKLFRVDREIKGVEIKYDVYNQVVNVKSRNQFFTTKDEYILEFEIDKDSKTHRFINSQHYLGLDDFSMGFLRSLFEGNTISLFAKDAKKRSVQDSSEPYTSSKNYVKYTDELQYLLFKDGKFEEVKSPKKITKSYPSLKDYKKITAKTLKDEDFLVSMAKFLDN